MSAAASMLLAERAVAILFSIETSSPDIPMATKSGIRLKVR